MKLAKELLRALGDHPYGEGIAKRAKFCRIVQFAANEDNDDLDRPHAYVLGQVVCPPPHGTGKAHRVEARLYPPHRTLASWVSCDCGNFRYCVSPDTLINTEKGLVPIEHLEKSELKVLTLGGEIDQARVIRSGEESTVRVRTSRGFELRATDNELLLVLESTMELAWKRVDALNAGDVVALQPGSSRRGTDLVPIPFEYRPTKRANYFREINGTHTEVAGHEARNFKRYQVPSTLTPELARVLGYLVAEGYTDHNTISFPQKDREVLEDYLSCWNASFPDAPLCTGKEVRGTVIAEIRSVYLSQFLQQAGYDVYARAATKKVPDPVFVSPLPTIRSFLSGLFEGDGWATATQVGYDSNSLELVKQVQQLLLLFGVVSSRSGTPSDLGKYSLWCGGTYAQNFHERIGFVSSRKKGALQLADPVGRTIPHAHALLRSCLRASGYYMVKGEQQRLNLYHKTLQANEDRTGAMYEKTLRTYLDTHPDLQKAYPDIHERLNWVLDTDCEWDRVEAVSDPEVVMTYDAVVPGAHHFVGNGFIVHNTWEVAAMLAMSSSVRYSNGALSRSRNVKHIPAPCKHLTRFLLRCQKARDIQKIFAGLSTSDIKRVRKEKLMKQRGIPKELPKPGERRPRPEID